MFISIFVVVLNLLANLINALLFRETPGYSEIPISKLMVFWVSRPRMAWLATALVNFEKEKSMYFSAAASALLAETILQTIGAIYILRAVHFGSTNGFYMRHSKTFQGSSLKHAAALFYGGAILWAVSVAIFYLYIILLLNVSEGRRALLAIITWLRMFFNALNYAFWQTVTWTKIFFIQLKHAFRYAFWLLLKSRFTPRMIQSTLRLFIDDDEPELDINIKSKRQINMKSKGEMQSSTENQVTEWSEALKAMGLSVDRVFLISIAFIFLLLPWVGQWLFWIGFVQLYEDW
jgi:hypothetical protein